MEKGEWLGMKETTMKAIMIIWQDLGVYGRRIEMIDFAITIEY